MSSSKASFEFHASPHGKRVGTWTVRGKGLDLTFVVVPKPWRIRSVSVVLNPARPTTVIVSETERVRVFGEEPLLSLVRDHCRAASAAEAQDLFQVGSIELNRAFSVEETDVVPPSALLTAFFGLVVRARAHEDERLMTVSRTTGCDGDAALADAFLREVANAMRDVGPLYREIVETAPTVRGRIVTNELVRRRASGAVALTCRYDELSLDVGFFRGIVMALELVARRPPPAPLDEFWRRLRVASRAVQLRYALGQVRTTTIAQAMPLLQPDRVPATHTSWRRSVLLARAVLEESALRQPSGDDERIRTVSLQIPSDRLWERILITSLETSPDFGRVVDGNTSIAGQLFHTPPPWLGLGLASRRPDIFVQRAVGPDWLCVDAKYKLGHSTPSDEDLAQLFLYSHHTRVRSSGESPSDFVLAYPCSGAPILRGPFRRGDRSPGVRLWVVAAPFPEPDDLVGGKRWDDIRSRIATSFLLRPRTAVAAPLPQTGAIGNAHGRSAG